ncbi:DEAD/DEAH box helicase [Cellulomonas gilvus]|uniref:Helicase domain protein n=1 Tax=Cellulomonas gilvus (strain ATCC 13127 / NRRL B-14078) TaxID=593907 RepID=F8A5R9_CELGA|nr:DEAD/DEAH box helicase [Cellulomonas gilvus]AEI13359.1 helicase domain protein [Cellulomonas gilvus ATCC 13127]
MATPLRRWQEDALAKWLTRRRGVASVVTGAGKTRFALACMSVARTADPAIRVLIVVPTLALVDQWLTVMQADGTIGRSDLAVHRDGRVSDHVATFHVATVNTARVATQRLTASGRWMIVADECHRYASPSNRTAIDAEWSASLGLSATPSREYDQWFEEFVEPAIGPVFYEYGYADAASDGVLAPFRLTNYSVPLTPSEEDQYTRLTKRIAALSADEIANSEAIRRGLVARSRVTQGARARIPAAVAIMSRHLGERSLVFHEKVAAAEEIAGRLMDAGHRVATYHSQMSPAQSLRSLLLFRTGQADVLVSCRALDEGLDVPNATFGLVCASSASTRQRVQRLGRLLRPSPGKTVAEVATIFATQTERDRLAAEERRLEGLADVTWFEVSFR